MKKLSIKVQERKELGKKFTKQLRSQENVPCVMYGGDDVIHFYTHENEFRKLIYTDQVYLVELDIEGKKINAVLKEIQFHPVTDSILHLDFVQVIEGTPSIVSLPVKLTGTSEGILAGGKLRQRRRTLKVKGLVKDMPEVLEVDITNLNIGDVTKVGDLDYPNLEILDPAQAMVVGVVSSRLAAKGMEVVDETAEGEEAEATEEAAAPAGETAAKGEE
jgi:large subunit ribosomal protein L25